MADCGKRKKIVILGGGMAALTMAFELTNAKDWQDRFESITVYQLGWRLGGKGASGRGPHGRIEEHGLHLWLGFYENAFRVIRQCYAELNRPPDAPLARWDCAFKKASFVGLADRYAHDWKLWTVNFPEDNRIPGTPDPRDPELTVWYYVKRAIALMVRVLESLGASTGNGEKLEQGHSLWETVRRDVAHLATEVEANIKGAAKSELLVAALELAEYMDNDAAKHTPDHHDLLLRLLEEFGGRLRKDLKQQAEQDVAVWRLWSLLELCMANIRGVFADGLLTGGFSKIDRYDYQAWLKRHHAPDEVLEQSAFLRGIYDLVFAYRGGDATQPAFAAGQALRSICRIFFSYKGAIFWKMQAGMGDVVFAPLYLVLKRRGVQFRFFHRVKNLRLSTAGEKKSITAIELARQLNLIDEKQGYQPLIDVKGLPCWPAEPLYEQLREGQQLYEKSRQSEQTDGYNLYNLESFWTKWQEVGECTLRAGEDFDCVVLGISLGSLPAISQELIADKDNPKWKLMVEKVETVQTQAFQVWLSEDMENLGWTLPPIDLSAYVEPFDTWADMRQLIEREAWPADQQPKSIAYFCNVMQTPQPPPPLEDHHFPILAGDRVKANALTFLLQHIGTLWPRAVHQDDFRWELLVGGGDATGEKRFDSQFWRANIDPSERYVQSVPCSAQYRLKTDETGYDNLYIVGDWIDCGFNVGCIEAAVMAGMEAAHAISGSPKLEHIIGYGHP